MPASAVRDFLRPSAATIPTFTLASGTDWTRIYCTQGTLQYKLSGDETDNGDLYTLEIKGFSPDDSSDKAQALDSLFAKKKFLVRYCDNSGLIRLAGTPQEPLTLSYDFGTDADVGGARGYSLDLKGTLTQRPAYA